VPSAIATSKQFFLWDYKSTLFPLRTNELMVTSYSTEILDFVQNEILGVDGGFQNQHRVFATKRGWFLRPTVKLDPVAEYFFYDFIYRNRQLFRKSPVEARTVYGYRIVKGEPVSILRSYATFKKAVAKHRASYSHYAYFDVSAYFNHIYHHDLIRWCEDAGADDEDVQLFGKFLREIVAGRSTNCLPQGIYPSKMVGSSFLGFLEASSRMRSAQSVRLMDDIWLFDDDSEIVIADFLNAQSLLSDRGLAVNEDKSSILEGHDPEQDFPPRP
jgi:Reverse transcriptase (RNA-dependent DNA polymerase)